MKNYSIIVTNSIQSLIEAVNKMINDGFEPIGGMCVQQWTVNGAFNYYQTMYKKLTPEPIVEEPPKKDDKIIINLPPIPIIDNMIIKDDKQPLQTININQPQKIDKRRKKHENT